MRADDILRKGIDIIAERGEHYSTDDERNMRTIVATFNAATDNSLTVVEGWLFMVALKFVRVAQDSSVNLDHFIDGANYFALAAEEATKNGSGSR